LIYLDTSVLAPFYWTEASSDAVEQLFQQYAPLIISELSEVDRGDAVAIAARFQADLDAAFYQLVTVTPRHYAMAKQWMQQFDTPLRTLDALHLAIASELSMPLVTADIGLARSAASLNVAIQVLQP
jgi:uncharacterized protein